MPSATSWFRGDLHDPTRRETAVRHASRAATLKGIRTARQGARRRRPGSSTAATPSPARSTAASSARADHRIELERLRSRCDPPFLAAWDPDPRRHFDAPSSASHRRGADRRGQRRHDGGFEDFEHLFVGRRRWRWPPMPGRSRPSRFTPAASGRWRQRLGPRRQGDGMPVATLLGGASRSRPTPRSASYARRASAPRTPTC